jgi:hypothetical protein
MAIVHDLAIAILFRKFHPKHDWNWSAACVPSYRFYTISLKCCDFTSMIDCRTRGKT